MKPTLVHRALKTIGLLSLSLLFCVQQGAAQSVELTAEIEIVWWGCHGRNPPSINSKTYTARCVVGTNTWLIEGDFLMNAKDTWWFTGTNLIEQTLITKDTAHATTKEVSGISSFAMSVPPKGSRNIRTFDSTDGNPGRPVRVGDLMSEPGKIAWLAFCSGSFLKQQGRHIPLPSDIWKEVLPASWETTEKTTTFEDELGLPERIVLYTSNNQPVLQYRATLSTNVLDWNFPLEFYLAQYGPAGTNAWELHLTAKGTVTSIGIGSKPGTSVEASKR
jgi:hypothetical protein